MKLVLEKDSSDNLNISTFDKKPNISSKLKDFVDDDEAEDLEKKAKNLTSLYTTAPSQP